MRSALLPLLAILFLSGCGSNPSTPAAESVRLSSVSSLPGSVVSVQVTYRISAGKSGGSYVSDPFSTVVILPRATAYTAGSSKIFFQNARTPDLVGNCADGRQYLLYDFAAGEFDDPFDFKEYSVVIGFDTMPGLAADGQPLTAKAVPTPPSDPCNLSSEDTETVYYSVSGTAATPTPTPAA